VKSERSKGSTILFANDETDFVGSYKSCELCPRACRVDRTRSAPGKGPGFCGESDQLRVAYVGPHFGEEPPITGTRGSGTVFFSGCSLKCKFCQNHQISRGGMGEAVAFQGLMEKIREMILKHNVHNLNFVTSDHFIPHAARVSYRIKKERPELPILYNFSGYQSLKMLKRLEEYADIYLPDFKYSDASLAKRFSTCADYPGKALDAISEMVRQKGFLDCLASGNAVATSGVMVRHMILPGAVENSIDALTILFIEFGPHLPISLMSQYQPVVPQEGPEMNRPITKQEFEKVYDHAKQLGFEFMFVQFPEGSKEERRKGPSFVPDFKKRQPFKL